VVFNNFQGELADEITKTSGCDESRSPCLLWEQMDNASRAYAITRSRAGALTQSRRRVHLSVSAQYLMKIKKKIYKKNRHRVRNTRTQASNFINLCYEHLLRIVELPRTPTISTNCSDTAIISPVRLTTATKPHSSILMSSKIQNNSYQYIHISYNQSDHIPSGTVADMPQYRHIRYRHTADMQ
jgi:hypothetical protein